MKTYIITYDLCRPGQNYQQLIATLSGMQGAVHFQQSVWLIRSASGAAELRDTLFRLMDQNDKLFVSEVSQNAAWYAGTTANNNAISAAFRIAA